MVDNKVLISSVVKSLKLKYLLSNGGRKLSTLITQNKSKICFFVKGNSFIFTLIFPIESKFKASSLLIPSNIFFISSNLLSGNSSTFCHSQV
ncbi:MAG: hypothetical protein LBU14_05060 [Candidatus Peribacteria bacterium]|nr:hypothetical protein [Candidatus Peribacteria bacterium]